MSDQTDLPLVVITTGIVANYVGNNAVPTSELPALIAAVQAALVKLQSGAVEETAKVLTPAISIKKSITPDYIICLEDGKKFKSLKRHLRTQYDLSPDDYRAKWGLPPDYPMVAPNYAQARSDLAKSMGLGQQRRKAAPAPEPVKAAKGGRKKAAK
ncbi:MAG: MucR family transcriptional regulator [Burkholderiales bacterium]|jgi:predicted transcriptional regulator|nr:MucR family transcriptional regulator [Burkholderiales bacterium]